ncbi:2'-hydroxyisoflavone reductase [Kitasatospora sp. MAP12-15]|uniref:NAD-dependent epimerase/dehydratase family protein n=1 Tax=unclassified Kitasatospora TaxID=2633591 RepID=UPI0024760510|nr:NAD-dependent epimerase/dehydratase family protein [Kitasatospora sp. MAP12-44]MDH6114176.1 2'-hydroxyisoflavone reductase [Kitasatospora sp. MAP12-44]
MRLLVIGGSVFLGQAFVADALARGWEVTTFNRGQTAVDLPGVRVVRGDREVPADLERLAAAGPWDAVVDVCGYVPQVVGASVRALAEQTTSYVFVSSINAVQGWPEVPVDESSPRQECAPDAGREDGDYGVLKSGCERAVEEGFPAGALILQPGLIMGPGDRARRLTWWLDRAARGGRMVAPGAPGRTMQLIDARDIAAFGLDQVERGAAGRYLVSGVRANTTWGEYLGECVALTGGRAELVWVDDALLREHEVEMWTELPLWSPVDSGPAVWEPDSAKAIAAGLRCRPVAESIRDTWAWLDTPQGQQEAFGAYRSFAQRSVQERGLSPEKEQRILDAWDARG